MFHRTFDARLKAVAISVLAFVLFGLLAVPPLSAGTRLLYQGGSGVVITGHAMDWSEAPQGNIWSLPRGVVRNGGAGPKSHAWSARYGSVALTSYDLGTVDGMNEAGLVANLLYFKEADYGTTGDKPAMSVSLWAQYALDSFASVRQAVVSMEQEPFRLVAPDFPSGRKMTFSLALSDSTGDSAILEYVDGDLAIYHGKQFRVAVDNSPYEQQIEQNAYWERIGSVSLMPGTSHPADRFARASVLLKSLPRELDRRFVGVGGFKSYVDQASTSVMGLMRHLSVPLLSESSSVWPTVWRTVADHRGRLFYFDSALLPTTFWVDLSKIDFGVGASARKIPLNEQLPYSGDVSGSMVVSQPFEFLRADPFAAVDALVLGEAIPVALPSPRLETVGRKQVFIAGGGSVTHPEAKPPAPLIRLRPEVFDEPVGRLVERVEVVPVSSFGQPLALPTQGGTASQAND